MRKREREVRKKEKESYRGRREIKKKEIKQGSEKEKGKNTKGKENKRNIIRTWEKEKERMVVLW